MQPGDTNNQSPPTTLEMDGLITEEDIANRFYVVRKCLDCGKHTKVDYRADEKRSYKCATCSSPRYNRNKQHSVRSYLAMKARGAEDKTGGKNEGA